MIIPQCTFCKNFNYAESTCQAFPGEAIPDEIIYNHVDHRQPFPGDNGVRWDPIQVEGAPAEFPGLAEDTGENELPLASQESSGA